MKLTLSLFVFAFVVIFAAKAQEQCPGPNWENTQCYQAYWQCFEDESCYFQGGWTTVLRIDCYGYDPSIGQQNSCSYYIGGCSNSCYASTGQKKQQAPYIFDPVKLVMNLFPRVHVDVLPVGRNGRCARVVRRSL